MSKLKLAFPALALLALCGSASAASTAGWITALDPQSRMITLSDGTRYQLGQMVDESKLAVGEQAVVTYDVQGKTAVATEILAGFYPVNDSPQTNQ